MGYRDRFGKTYDEPSAQDKLLKVMYHTAPGRALVKILCHPRVSRIGGAFLKSSVSKVLIRPFVRSHDIDLSLYKAQTYDSYNDFFIRELKPQQRPLPADTDVLMSPCDGRVSVYPIDKNQKMMIKNAEYTVASLLRDQKLADKFAGGYCFVIRLTVDNYHHFCYVDDGQKTDNRQIAGVLHTVNPAAEDCVRIYKENSREYTMIRTAHFDDVIQMEVGAMMVGRIVNLHQRGRVRRGQEKGFFEFGGSTVIVLVKRGQVSVRMDILENMKDGYETMVQMGEELGYKL